MYALKPLTFSYVTLSAIDFILNGARLKCKLGPSCLMSRGEKTQAILTDLPYICVFSIFITALNIHKILIISIDLVDIACDYSHFI